MNNLTTFAVRTFWLLCLTSVVGCTSSQEAVLGPAPMTSEEVIEEVLNGQDSGERWAQTNTLLTRDSAEQYHNVGWAQSAWDKQATYLRNEQLIIYFYPKRDQVGGIRPGYVTEIPLYRQVHMSWSEE